MFEESYCSYTRALFVLNLVTCNVVFIFVNGIETCSRICNAHTLGPLSKVKLEIVIKQISIDSIYSCKAQRQSYDWDGRSCIEELELDFIFTDQQSHERHHYLWGGVGYSQPRDAYFNIRRSFFRNWLFVHTILLNDFSYHSITLGPECIATPLLIQS